MKGKLARVALTVLTLCMLTVATLSPAHALSWDGSSTGGGGGTSPTSPGGYAVRYTNAESCVVGYRFSVIDEIGITQGKAIDVYKGSGGFNNPKFSTKYNKADLIQRQNNGWSTSTSTYLCIKQSELGISLPAPSGMGTWQQYDSNLNPILNEISPSLSVNTLVYGDKVLVEPIIEIAIAGTYHSFTVTEMALYGKHMLGVNSNGGSSSNSGSWGFIATYTNKNFPNLLRASSSYGIWTGVSSALTSQTTFYNIINKGYGVGVAFTQTQNKGYRLDVNGLLDGVSSGNTEGYGTFDVYINGVLKYNNATDCYYSVKSGDKYEIKDIKAEIGKNYKGVYSGSLSGTITGNTSAKLEFATNRLTIYYNANGGSTNSSEFALWSNGNVYKTATQETVVTKGIYNDPIDEKYGVTDGSTFGLYRTGYQWMGWNTKADGTGNTIGENDLDLVPTDLTSAILTGDAMVTLYAQWATNGYTIVFNGNGATGGNTASMSMVQNVAKNLTANGFYRTGYTFNGWNTRADGSGTWYSDRQLVNNLTTVNGGTVTLYAQWSKSGYTIVFNGNGATGGSTASMSMTYGVGKYLTANGFYRTGYTFNGWNTRSDGNGTWYEDQEWVYNLTTVSGGTVTLYAQWKPNTYTIVFNGNGASGGSTASMSMTYNEGKYLTANGFYRTGYTFSGWNTRSDGNGTWYSDREWVYNLTTVNGGTVTLYAQWKPNTYTIVFNGNGYTGGSTASMSMTYGVGKYLTANGFYRTGYTFNGWNTRSDGSGTWYENQEWVYNLTTVSGGTVTLYAQWTPTRYTIVFDGNGATGGSTASMSMTYGVAKNLTPNGFVRIGYAFVGWNTRADGNGTWYADGETVKNLTTVNGGVVTLYAQWQESLALEPIAPNAAYRETTEVVTSYWLMNDSDKDYTPADDVNLRFVIKYPNGTVYRTITQEQVVVPGNEKNLVYIKWEVPDDIVGGRMTIEASLEQYGGEKMLANRAYTTAAYTLCQTPDTQFEYEAPASTYSSVPSAQSATVTWSEFVYEDGDFVEKTYQFRLLTQAFDLVPDSESAVFQGWQWTMKSGYGLFCEGAPTYLGTALGGYLQPTTDSYTMPQYVYALYPEYGYTYGEETCTTLTRGTNPTLPEFLDYGRVHFTPIWYPDGAYTVAVVSRDCWTPVGMVKATTLQTVQIEGSVYDDWYVGRR